MTETQTCRCGGAQALALDDGRWAELDALVTRYRGQPGALIQVLHQAQELFGHLPPEVQQRIAAGLEVPASDVYGVVTFYSFFTMVPRGLHTIRVCLGTACYVRGGRRVLERVKSELGIGVGGTTEDGLFSLEVVRCIGACGLAPVMTVDGNVYQRVKPSKIGELLARYRDEGGRSPAA